MNTKLTPSERTKIWKEKNQTKHREQWLKYYQDHSEAIKAKKRAVYKIIKLNKLLDDMSGEPTGIFKNK